MGPSLLPDWLLSRHAAALQRGLQAIFLGLVLGSRGVALARCTDGHDFGSGMLATGLPAAEQRRLHAAHTLLQQQAAAQLAPAWRKLPYSPHISVLYGLEAAKQLQLQPLLATLAAPAPVQLGALLYWDDTAGDKTTLAIEVHDADARLGRLHRHAAASLQLTTRFAYRPHITLAFLKPRQRLSSALEAQLRQLLHGPPFIVNDYYLTDACGLVVGRAAGNAAADP